MIAVVGGVSCHEQQQQDDHQIACIEFSREQLLQKSIHRRVPGSLARPLFGGRRIFPWMESCTGWIWRLRNVLLFLLMRRRTFGSRGRCGFFIRYVVSAVGTVRLWNIPIIHSITCRKKIVHFQEIGKPKWPFLRRAWPFQVWSDAGCSSRAVMPAAGFFDGYQEEGE